MQQIELLLCAILETPTSFRAFIFHFQTLAQQVGQPTSQYIQILITQASKCQYDTFLDEALIDQLIFGIYVNGLRKRLFPLAI